MANFSHFSMLIFKPFIKKSVITSNFRNAIYLQIMACARCLNPIVFHMISSIIEEFFSMKLLHHISLPYFLFCDPSYEIHPSSLMHCMMDKLTSKFRTKYYNFWKGVGFGILLCIPSYYTVKFSSTYCWNILQNIYFVSNLHVPSYYANQRQHKKVGNFF